MRNVLKQKCAENFISRFGAVDVQKKRFERPKIQFSSKVAKFAGKIEFDLALIFCIDDFFLRFIVSKMEYFLHTFQNITPLLGQQFFLTTFGGERGGGLHVALNDRIYEVSNYLYKYIYNYNKNEDGKIVFFNLLF